MNNDDSDRASKHGILGTPEIFHHVLRSNTFLTYTPEEVQVHFPLPLNRGLTNQGIQRRTGTSSNNLIISVQSHCQCRNYCQREKPPRYLMNPCQCYVCSPNIQTCGQTPGKQTCQRKPVIHLRKRFYRIPRSASLSCIWYDLVIQVFFFFLDAIT